MAIVQVEKSTPEQLAQFKSATPGGVSRTSTNWDLLCDGEEHAWAPDEGTPADKVGQKKLFFTEALRLQAKRRKKVIILDFNKTTNVLRFMAIDPITPADHAYLAKPEWKPKTKEQKAADEAAKAATPIANVNESETDTNTESESEVREQPQEEEVPVNQGGRRNKKHQHA